jgi:hypothetical protein
VLDGNNQVKIKVKKQEKNCYGLKNACVGAKSFSLQA